MTNRTVRVEAHGLFERPQGFVIPEAVEQRESLIKPLPRFGRFRRDRNVRLTDAFHMLGGRQLCNIHGAFFRVDVVVSLPECASADEDRGCVLLHDASLGILEMRCGTILPKKVRGEADRLSCLACIETAKYGAYVKLRKV